MFVYIVITTIGLVNIHHPHSNYFFSCYENIKDPLS